MTALHSAATFVRGDTWEIEGSLHAAGGAPFDLTGATVQWKVEDAAGASVLSYSIGNGIAVTDLAGGKILIRVPASASAAIVPGTYKDQLRVTDGAGVVSTQWVGSFTVKTSFFVP